MPFETIQVKDPKDQKSFIIGIMIIFGFIFYQFYSISIDKLRFDALKETKIDSTIQFKISVEDIATIHHGKSEYYLKCKTSQAKGKDQFMIIGLGIPAPYDKPFKVETGDTIVKKHNSNVYEVFSHIRTKKGNLGLVKTYQYQDIF